MCILFTFLPIASPRIIKTGNYSIKPDQKSLSRYSLQISIDCSGWPNPNISIQISTVGRENWTTFSTAMNSTRTRYKTHQTNPLDSRGIPVFSFDFSIEYSWKFPESKLRFVCSNDHGENTSNEITFKSMHPYHYFIVLFLFTIIIENLYCLMW